MLQANSPEISVNLPNLEFHEFLKFDFFCLISHVNPDVGFDIYFTPRR
jgi:hypothetical protein